MSMSIKESIAEAKAYVASLTKVYAKYPDVEWFRIGDVRVPVSVLVEPTDVQSSEGGPMWAYAEIDGTRVYVRPQFPASQDVQLSELKLTNPEAYAALVRVVGGS